MRTTELSGERVIGSLATVFFTVLALYLVVLSVRITFFFRDPGGWDPSYLRMGLIYLLYAAVFAAVARLVAARVPRRRYWLPLAIVALPALPQVEDFVPRPGAYAVALGLLLVLVYAIGYTTFWRHRIA